MYTPLDKAEMEIRQHKVDTGQGMGNALSNAIAYCGKAPLKEILAIRDEMFASQQEAIAKHHREWLVGNSKRFEAVGYVIKKEPFKAEDLEEITGMFDTPPKRKVAGAKTQEPAQEDLIIEPIKE